MVCLVTRLQMTGLKYKIKYCLLHDKVQMKEHTHVDLTGANFIYTAVRFYGTLNGPKYFEFLRRNNGVPSGLKSCINAQELDYTRSFTRESKHWKCTNNEIILNGFFLFYKNFLFISIK
jgi:hypothetical protein